MLNTITVMGRIVNEPELKTTANGILVCSFRIAAERRYQNKGEERQSDFFNVVAWRGTAEFINRYFSKGSLIMIIGEMQTRQYTDKNGFPATWYEIVVDRVCFTGEKRRENASSASATPSEGTSAGNSEVPLPPAPPEAGNDNYPF